MRFAPAFLTLATIGSAAAAPGALQAREDRVEVDVCTGINLGGCINVPVWTQHDCRS